MFDWLKRNTPEPGIKKASTLVRIKQTAGRSLESLQRLFNLGSSEIFNTDTSIDQFLKQHATAARNTAKLIAKTDPIAKSYLGLLETNVIGPKGFRIQIDTDAKKGLTQKVADAIEAEFQEWSKKATADGKHSLLSACRLAQRTEATDGEAFIRLLDLTPDQEVNGFNFAIQLMSTSWLDTNHNTTADQNGDYISMGIKFNKYGKPLAYYFKAENSNSNTVAGKHIVVAAEDMIHKFITEEIGQSRGYSWFATVTQKMKHFNAYSDAVVISERVSASKMGFLVQKDSNQEYDGDETTDEQLEIEVAPATITQLPKNFEFQEWNPTSSNANFAEVSQSILRQIASGFRVSYNALTSDLTGVNYSSLRSGMLQDRDTWRVLQADFIERVMARIFERFIKNAILAGRIKLPNSLQIADVIKNIRWIARGWEWVDPLKDVQASLLAINGGLASRTQTLAETGEDFEQIAKRLAAEKELIAELGLSFDTQTANKPTTANTDPAQA